MNSLFFGDDKARPQFLFFEGENVRGQPQPIKIFNPPRVVTNGHPKPPTLEPRATGGR